MFIGQKMPVPNKRFSNLSRLRRQAQKKDRCRLTPTRGHQNLNRAA